MRGGASPPEEIGPPGPPGHDPDGIHASEAEGHSEPFEMAPSRRRTPRSDPRTGRSRERPVRGLLAHWPHLRWLVRSPDSPDAALSGRRCRRLCAGHCWGEDDNPRGQHCTGSPTSNAHAVSQLIHPPADPAGGPSVRGPASRGMWLRVQSAHPRGGWVIGSSRPPQPAPCRSRRSRRRTPGSRAQDCASAWCSVPFWGCRCSTTSDSAWPLAWRPAWLPTPSLVVGVTSQKAEIRTRRNGDGGSRRTHGAGGW
jgi:hypothetical protein